jgi:hypothetical protein
LSLGGVANLLRLKAGKFILYVFSGLVAAIAAARRTTFLITVPLQG